MPRSRWLSACVVAACGILLALPGAALSQPRDPAAPSAPAEELQAALSEGERLAQTGAWAQARGHFERALALSEALGDERAVAKSLFGVGRAQWGTGDYTRALETHRRALALRREQGDAAGEFQSLISIGVTLYNMTRHAEALEHYNQALEVNRRLPSPLPQGVLLGNIGLVYRYWGRFQEAVQFFERSLEDHRRHGNKAGEGQTLNHFGMVARASGQYERALEYYRQSLALRREAGNLEGESQALNNMANVYLDLGQPEEAITRYVEALELARRIGYTAQVGFSTGNIGAALHVLGRDREALARYEAALAVWRQMDRRGEIASSLLDIARSRFDLGELAAARLAALESLEIARAIAEPEKVALALDQLALVELRSGSPALALARLDEALGLATATGTPNLEYAVRASRGLALRALGRRAEAAEEMRSAIRIVNDLRAKVASDVGKIGFLDVRQRVFHDLAVTLTDLGRHEEALEAAEAGRARAFADLLLQRQVLGKPAERAALEQLRAVMDVRGRAPAAAIDSPGGRGEEAVAAPERLERALEGLRSRSEELASLVSVESPAAVEMRQAAARLGATLVEYLVTEDRLLTWVVTPAGDIHALEQPISRESLTAQVRELRERIGKADAGELGHPERLAPLLRRLDRALIAPLERWLPALPDETVVIVPHGPLALLPFAALRDARGRPLAERHTLAFAPAIAIFRYTEAKRAAARSRSLRPLVVADPRAPAGSGLPRLSGSAVEGRRVAARLAGSGVRLLVGPQASEAAVKQASPESSLLHFATHGLVSADRPLDSSLVLGDGDGEDGYLRVAEVFGLDLKADLVVLSGCSTGLGRLSGDGILGLPRAFIYAGAPSVVFSLWDVADSATAFLMDRFHAGLRAGRSKARALRVAQREARARYPHPAHWAAFALVGEPE